MTIPPYLSYNVRNRDPFSKKLHLPSLKLRNFVKIFNFCAAAPGKVKELTRKVEILSPNAAPFALEG